MNEDEWTDDMWFMDVPISLQAYEEDVSENWAPRWTRCWSMQMQNAIVYIDSLDAVYRRAWRQFARVHNRMVFRNRQRPRALRRQGSRERQLLAWRRFYLKYMRAYRSMSPATRSKLFHGSMKMAKSVGGYMLRSARSYARTYGLNRKRSLNNSLQNIGQGRVQNWKQIKMTGTGKKIHRRGRRYRYRRRRVLKRRYSRNKRRYLGWLYKNRPAIYQSFVSDKFTMGVYNMPIYRSGDAVVTYPGDSIYSFNITNDAPDQLTNLRADYILFKQRWEFIFRFSNDSANVTSFTHAYVRVISFRKYGQPVSNDVQSSLWSMFKYPYLLTSGYVTGFKRRWCKEFGIQLYSDKLLRISDETNWVTEYKINFYPRMHTRYNTKFDQDRWYYRIFIIAGFGPEDKYHNPYVVNVPPRATLTLNVDYNRGSYWKFVTGMPLSEADQQKMLVTGVPDQVQGNEPKSGGFDEREGSGLSGKEPAGETGATGSTPAPSNSFVILHDDN
nr:capsid protein [Banfec virus 5]